LVVIGISISIVFTPFRYINNSSVLGDNISILFMNEMFIFVDAKYGFVVNILHNDLIYNPNGIYSRGYKNWILNVRIYTCNKCNFKPLSKYNRPLSKYNRPLSKYNRPLSKYNRPLSKYNRTDIFTPFKCVICLLYFSNLTRKMANT